MGADYIEKARRRDAEEIETTRRENTETKRDTENISTTEAPRHKDSWTADAVVHVMRPPTLAHPLARRGAATRWRWR
jgi:hypothetical protein